jgi:2-polyprenyl-3-methyl-5-hydroxy-6-metoxy-1,4-benzoquinol methylase
MKISRTSDILEWVKGPAVLDVGCTGHAVEASSPDWLHGRFRISFPRVVGIDINPANIKVLKDLGYDHLHTQSAENIDLPEKFDTIFAGELIEHLANPGLFLESARKHLNPQGRLVLTTPNPFSLSYSAYAAAKYPKTCQNDEHTCWLCPQTITALLARYRYKVSHFQLIGYYRPDDPSLIYRAGLRMLRLFSAFIPARFVYNTMLVVAEAES